MRIAVVIALLVACANETPSQRFIEEMKAACAAHVCPADPPMYIVCMPVIPPDEEAICGGECRDVLAHTCMIQFVE